MELALIKDDLKGYLTESKSLVTLDTNNIRELTEQVCSQVKKAQSSFYNDSTNSINVLMTGQEEIVRSLKQCCSVVERGQLRIEQSSREDLILTKVANVNLTQQVLRNGKRSYRTARTINKSITQLRQQNRVENRQLRKLIAKIDHGRQVSGFEISSIQPTRHSETLEAVVLPLSLMRSSLYRAISRCLEIPTIDVPQEYLEFLARQFEELLACSHVVSSQKYLPPSC